MRHVMLGVLRNHCAHQLRTHLAPAHLCALPGGQPSDALRACRASSSASASTSDTTVKSRAYPAEPRVGVGVVVFRRPGRQGQHPEILLIQRGKEPNKGAWCFPGGSQELGETLAECAAREVEEETGLRIQVHQGVDDNTRAWSDDLSVPTAFAAVDSIQRDSSDNNTIRYHYTIVEVAALVHPADTHRAPRPSDDALSAMWHPVPTLRTLQGLIPQCVTVTEEAVRRFPVIAQPTER